MNRYVIYVDVTRTAAIAIQADSETEAMRLFGKAWHDDTFQTRCIKESDHYEDPAVDWMFGDTAQDGRYDADLTQDAHKAIVRIGKKEGKR